MRAMGSPNHCNGQSFIKINRGFIYMLVSSICGSNNKVHNVNVKNSAGLDLKGGDAPQGSFKISYM